MSAPPRNTRPPRALWLLLASGSALLMVGVAAWLGIAVFRTLRSGGPMGPAGPTPASVEAHSEAVGVTAPGCSVQRSAPLAFSSERAHDTLRVRIEGTPCSQARLSIVLEGADGTPLYSYDASFPPHLTAEEAAKPLPQTAEAFAESVIANARIAGTTDALPPWRDAVAYYAEHRDAIKIGRAAYEGLRHQHLPIFWHATGPETWRSVVYDAQSGKGRVILAGGG